VQSARIPALRTGGPVVVDQIHQALGQQSVAENVGVAVPRGEPDVLFRPRAVGTLQAEDVESRLRREPGKALVSLLVEPRDLFGRRDEDRDRLDPPLPAGRRHAAVDPPEKRVDVRLEAPLHFRVGHLRGQGRLPEHRAHLVVRNRHPLADQLA
jgi:hypothetical protein